MQDRSGRSESMTKDTHAKYRRIEHCSRAWSPRWYFTGQACEQTKLVKRHATHPSALHESVASKSSFAMHEVLRVSQTPWTHETCGLPAIVHPGKHCTAQEVPACHQPNPFRKLPVGPGVQQKKYEKAGLVGGRGLDMHDWRTDKRAP